MIRNTFKIAENVQKLCNGMAFAFRHTAAWQLYKIRTEHIFVFVRLILIITDKLCVFLVIRIKQLYRHSHGVDRYARHLCRNFVRALYRDCRRCKKAFVKHIDLFVIFAFHRYWSKLFKLFGKRRHYKNRKYFESCMNNSNAHHIYRFIRDS